MPNGRAAFNVGGGVHAFQLFLLNIRFLKNIRTAPLKNKRPIGKL